MSTEHNAENIKLKHQLRSLLRTPSDVSDYLNVNLPEEVTEVVKHYPILTSPYYLSLIDKNNLQNDPIWKQVIPSIEELNSHCNASEDPLYEEPQMPVDRLIHRYKDRAVLLSTNRCTMQCRFCFRKRYWKSNSSRQDISDIELSRICSYLKQNNDIKEILLSGGDPLILGNSRLKEILDRLYATGNIEVVRIATRIPVTLPERISNSLVNILAEYPGLWFVTHFNHPNEVIENSIKACKKIIKAGIPILNQTVLLKGINDNSETLEALFRLLIKNRIKPHYLFHVDPVKGVSQFSTGIEKRILLIKI
jgi:lysine 2,3-aminomutase